MNDKMAEHLVEIASFEASLPDRQGQLAEEFYMPNIVQTKNVK